MMCLNCVKYRVVSAVVVTSAIVAFYRHKSLPCHPTDLQLSRAKKFESVADWKHHNIDIKSLVYIALKLRT